MGFRYCFVGVAGIGEAGYIVMPHGEGFWVFWPENSPVVGKKSGHFGVGFVAATEFAETGGMVATSIERVYVIRA